MLTVIKAGTQPFFIDFMANFDQQDALENSHSAKTAYKYQNMTANFRKYLAEKNKIDLLPSQIKIPLLQDFVRWLPANLKSCNRTHLSKHIYRIQNALNAAVLQGLIEFNPAAAYKLKRGKNKAVISLDDAEINLWIDAQWQSEIYLQAKDLYTYQMVTGLSYSDLCSYKTVNDANTGIWIEGVRCKTGKPFAVPLYHSDFTIALRIHEKYNGKLPYIENHFYNRLIREMAKILGIEKYITTHTGRKTFANRLNWDGYSDAAITGMMGNTDRVLHAHYLNFSKKKIMGDLLRRGA